MSSIWLALVEELHSSTYRASIAKLTGLNLEQQMIRISLGRLDPLMKNGSHSDSEGITLTHLLYFGREDWQIEWGGCLQILLNEQLESLFQEIPPRNGNERDFSAFGKFLAQRLSSFIPRSIPRQTLPHG